MCNRSVGIMFVLVVKIVPSTFHWDYQYRYNLNYEPVITARIWLSVKFYILAFALSKVQPTDQNKINKCFTRKECRIRKTKPLW